MTLLQAELGNSGKEELPFDRKSSLHLDFPSNLKLDKLFWKRDGRTTPPFKALHAMFSQF